ncbi:MAG: heparan-alpha-glucosaminide N-acetyltransferase domain-containing protein, partial [Microvirga sp.]
MIAPIMERRRLVVSSTTIDTVLDRPLATVRTRIESIDLLRGTIMIVMALDHTRDFFGAGGLNPRDVSDPALFLTRWITHFCAPLFIFLAGLSAYLYGMRGRSVGEVSRFLLTRGLWLIVMELTVMRVAWSFGFNLGFSVVQVIWALGASMVVLSALVYLPRWAIAAVGLVMIGGHNLLDGIHAADLGSAGWIWIILHERGFVPLGSAAKLFVLYPLVPWIGVMAAGYALGPVFQLDRAARRRWLVALGAITTVGFIVLRASNVYGDPAPWAMQSTALATLLSFINCEKYPPSLLYLAMTIGPGLLLLAAFETARGRVADMIITYGRVPFLYSVAHIVLIHALAVAMAWMVLGSAAWLIG